jgi:hypothetical protein
VFARCRPFGLAASPIFLRCLADISSLSGRYFFAVWADISSLSGPIFLRCLADTSRCLADISRCLADIFSLSGRIFLAVSPNEVGSGSAVAISTVMSAQ